MAVGKALVSGSVRSLQTEPVHGRRDRQGVRSASVGGGAALLGGLCCIGSALAFGAGVGGLSFFGTWMDRYQMYFVLASVLLMGVWLVRLVRREGTGRDGLLGAFRSLRRQAVVMGVTYVVIFGVALLASTLARGM